jgi:enamine deaminase RidA (YjgF/YER057c/UK114 family)
MKWKQMRMQVLLIGVLQFAVYQLQAQAPNNNIQKEKYHFSLGTQDTAAGYAQVIKVDNILYVSGTVCLQLNEKDFRYAYKVIQKSLEKFGATMQNVVKENIYTTDISAMEQLNIYRKEIYKGDYPTSTWVQVARLLLPEAKLEIEVVAHLPKG